MPNVRRLPARRFTFTAAVALTCGASACGTQALPPTDLARSFKEARTRQPVAPQHADYEGSFALLIGNSRYTNGWDPLETVPGELARLAAVLAQHGFTTFQHHDLDGAALRRVYDEFVHTHGVNNPDGRLLFFFAGHGHSEGGTGYIVGTDAPAPNASGQAGPDFFQRAIPMSQFVEWGRHVKARHALFVFDSCFSGAILNERGMPSAIAASIALPTRQFITAGRAGETVPGVSVFAELFADALGAATRLGDLNRDGYVTAAELGLYLKYQVPNRRPSQHPQYAVHPDRGYGEGDMVFTLPPPGAAPAPPSARQGELRFRTETTATIRVDGQDVEAPQKEVAERLAHLERVAIENNYTEAVARTEQLKEMERLGREQLRRRTELIRLRTVVYGGGVVAGLLAAGFTWRMIAKESSASPYCRGDLCREPGYGLRKQSRVAGDLATGFLYGGLALAAAGVVLHYFTPALEDPARRRSAVSIGPDGLRGTW